VRWLSPEIADGSATDALGLWCASQLGLPRPFENFAALGVFDGNELSAVVVYHNWYPENGVMELSCASTSPRWMTRPVLHEMFSFPFDRRGCQLVAMRVSEHNHTAEGRGLLRMSHAYGFEEHRIPRLRGRDEAEIIFTLTDDAWRANGFHKEHRNG